MITAIEEIVEPILHSPQLPLVVKKLNESLEEERQKRQRFYDEISEQQKAEFINGERIIHSPTKMHHIRVSRALFVLVSAYVEIHDLGFVGSDKMLISLSRNDYEPDICFFSKEKSQFFVSDQMNFPAPDFIVEILSKSTAKFDRGIKFEDFALHGVQEYWIIDPEAKMVEQYLLKEDRYELKVKSDSGVIHCEAIEGFTIPVNAIFDQQEHLHFFKEMFRT